MTLVSTIIQQAYRESNLIPLGATPSTNQTSEALGRLNTILMGTVGLEVGDDLEDLNVDGEYSDSYRYTPWVPSNSRLILNLSAADTLYLNPNPKEGMRFAVADVAGNLATYNLTLDANGRLIEGAETLVLSTNDMTAQWLYRGDTAGWTRIEEVEAADQMPFPIEFDDYFITMLAIRINPRYGQELSAESLNALKRARNAIRARYYNRKEILPDLPTRGLMNDNGYSDFDKGRNGIWWM